MKLSNILLLLIFQIHNVEVYLTDSKELKTSGINDVPGQSVSNQFLSLFEVLINFFAILI